MEDYPENALRKLCCTCLSKDRKLFQLCRLHNGVNNLYLLLSYDSDAYREGFYKDTANLFVCWECRAIIHRICSFRQQACNAQKDLTAIIDGRTDKMSQSNCRSKLSKFHTAYYETVVSELSDIITDNFIDCGPAADIKTESDDDIALSEFLNTTDNENYVHRIDKIDTTIDSMEPQLKKSKRNGEFKKKTKFKNGTKIKKFYSTVIMNESDLIESRLTRKMANDFSSAMHKCDSCIEMFQTQIDLETHNTSFHVSKDNYIQCDICLKQLESENSETHKLAHYEKYICNICEYIAFTTEYISEHIRKQHSDDVLVGKRKKRQNNFESKKKSCNSQMKSNTLDRKTSSGYLCSECNKYFDNKNQRWKHVQRYHREGYRCSTCGKRFAFKNNLSRHELLHKEPLPREECTVCHKMIRVDLIKIHSRIHSAREKFKCFTCDKNFVSRASYEHHLKYTQAHAAGDILKYKCSTCDKGYRSRGELRDHINYQHVGKTNHKCPVCGKALATRRCITRHVRRAHDGVKESARDKICQQCGKAFRDKKGLREHEFIHTGERPLACELCGGTFRQSASLYTHKKRVHNIFPPKKSLQLY